MKRKIAIIGGGIAGLAAAFEMTRTKALQEQLEVTVYQMGWRLGGKAASSRRSDGRIVEHGLHIWFGCYENAFEFVRAAYKDWKPQEGQAIRTLEEAFEEQRVTVIGSGDKAEFFAMSWPKFDGEPGDGGPPLTLWPCIRQLLKVMEAQYKALKPLYDPVELRIPPDITFLMAEAGVVLEGSFLRAKFSDCLTATWQWADTFAKNVRLRTEAQLRGFVRYLRLVSSHLWSDENFKEKLHGPFLQQLIDVGTTLVKGVILDMELGGTSVVELDALDFREWLSGNGANRESVYGSNIVQSIYDTTFQYCGGDKRRPSFGAGSAAQVSLRLFGGYKDAFAYESRAGLGEIVVAPIYRVLRDRGVRFEFFYKLTLLELNQDMDGVAQIHFDRQIDLRYPTYEPTIAPRSEFGYLECWPDTPLWDQILDGDTLEGLGLDLESYWCDQKTGKATLRQGHEFDDAVLAISVGAFKPLNDVRGPCAELIDASRRFKRMTDAASLVPTISVEAWCTRTPAEMGWPPREQKIRDRDSPDYPICTGPSPLNIWADRTVVLDHEHWGGVSPRPSSLQYLCDVFETTLYREPSGHSGVPQAAENCARKLAVFWFENKSGVLWPLASPNGTFDWNVLFDPDNGQGEDRIDYQVVKPNIDPWACCAGSPARSTQWRLKADRSGFDHLFLAGAWIDSGFNVESVEAAVMSGRQAARAITGTNVVIDGEDFLHFGKGLAGLIRELVIEAEIVAERVLGFALGRGGMHLRRRAP